jgi:hypothetical protein
MFIARPYHLINCHSCRHLFVALILLSLLPGVGLRAESEVYARYYVRVNSRLTEMQVELCFSNELAKALSTESNIAREPRLKTQRMNYEAN